MTDQAIFNKILNEKQLPSEFLTKVSISEISQLTNNGVEEVDDVEYIKIKIVSVHKLILSQVIKSVLKVN